MCKHAAVSLCCETEANTTLQSNYTPAKNNNEEKRGQLSLLLGGVTVHGMCVPMAAIPNGMELPWHLPSLE